MIEDIFNVLLTISTCDETNGCPASAFTAIGAAFATQGYYLQSSIVSAIGAGGMEMWGVFLYMFSFFAFMIMIILNGLSIPKNVMWFVLGPALFNWMVYTGADVKGVGWRIGNDYIDNQERVWELAEPGLRNIDPIVSGELDSSQATVSTANKEDAMNNIRVPWLFVFWDELISDTVAQLSSWIGADTMRPGTGGKSNLGSTPVELMIGLNKSSKKEGDAGAAILASLKWSKLQNIIGSRISTPMLRDAFVEFMAGSCGKELKNHMDEQKIVNATRSSKAFKEAKEEDITIFQKDSREKLKHDLSVQFTPTEGPLKKLLSKPENNNSEGTSLNKFLTDDLVKKITENEDDFLTCDKQFEVIVKALRWETGQIYHKMMADWDNGDSTKEKELLVSLFYGWNIDVDGKRIDDDKLKYYTRDMIFSYLLRNELQMAPNIPKAQFSTKGQAERASDTHMESVGSQNKYGEIYTWARMMPYLQGILMFVLAGAYPIVCIVFLIPGAHKTIITWAAFWAWVKFWDFGFALVSVIERSIWGAFGSSAQAAASNNTIAKVVGETGVSAVDVQCGSGPLGKCVFPNITDKGTADWYIEKFGRGAAVGLSLNYGVYNGYYIYIMAALYMAVPVICGQIILQGKHGVGSLASMMTGGAERAAGAAAEASAKSKVAASMNQTLASAEKATKAEAAKKYAIAAMDAGNKAARQGLMRGRADAMSSLAAQKSSLAKLGVDALDNRSKQLGAIAAVSTGVAASGLPLAKYIGPAAMIDSLFYQGISKIGDFKKEDFQNAHGYEGKEKESPGEATIASAAAGAVGAAAGGASQVGAKSSSLLSSALKPFKLVGGGAAKMAGGAAGLFNRVADKGLYALSQLNTVPEALSKLYSADFERQQSFGARMGEINAGIDKTMVGFATDNNSTMFKGYQDRMNTMAKYEGEQAWYDTKSELANDMQDVAGVFGINLQPTQAPYDINAMMGKGEVIDVVSDKNGNPIVQNDTQGMFNFYSPGGEFNHSINTTYGELLNQRSSLMEFENGTVNDAIKQDYYGVVKGGAQVLYNDTHAGEVIDWAKTRDNIVDFVSTPVRWGNQMGEAIGKYTTDEKYRNSTNEKVKETFTETVIPTATDVAGKVTSFFGDVVDRARGTNKGGNDPEDPDFFK